MPITRRPQPSHVQWVPGDKFTKSHAEGIEKNFRTLFGDMASTTDLVSVDRGGTGITAYSIGDLLYASATDVLSTLAVGTAGKVIQSTGVLPAWSSWTIPTSFSQGDLIYANAANTLVALAKDANATRYLGNTGSSNSPAWTQVNLANGVTGTLPVGNGGTGSTAFTAGSILFSNGTIVTQNNAAFFWQDGNNRLAIGHNAPTSTLDMRGVTPDIRLEHASSADFTSFRFYENGTQKAIIQHVGSTFATGTRQDDLEIFTLAATADVVIYINSAETTRFHSTGFTVPSGKTVTLSGITAGHVLFAGASGVVSGESNLFWDATNDRLGIGTSSPGGRLDVSAVLSVDQAFLIRGAVTHDTATAGTVYGAQFNTNMSHTTGTQPSVQGFFIQTFYRGTSAASPAVTNLQGVFCRVGIAGTSPTGTVTNARAFQIDQVTNQGAGTPAVTLTNVQGLAIVNQGLGSGSGGLTITGACGIAMANTTTATNNSNIVINSAGTMPSVPSGTWSIYNASANNNHSAGPIYMGHTTTWGSGTNFISFADGTIPGTPAANTGAIYADDVNGDTNLFAINEVSVTNQLTGLHIRKTADESVANNTIQNDDHFVGINLLASSSYEFEIYGFFTGAGTAGIQVQLDGTVGVSSLKANVQIFDATGASVAFGRITAFNAATGVDVTGNCYFVIRGCIETSTVGNIRLEWAQNTTDAGNATTLQENSFMVLRKLNA